MVIEFIVGLYSLLSWSWTFYEATFEWGSVAIGLRVGAVVLCVAAVARERASAVTLLEPVMCCQLGCIEVR